MKLTESKLRSIIREEYSRIVEQSGGEKYLNQFQQYLSSVGRGSGLEFQYEDYVVALDPGDFFLIVSLYRDRVDMEPAASARIEDDGVRYKVLSTEMGRPEITNEMYRSPDQVMSSLIEKAAS